MRILGIHFNFWMNRSEHVLSIFFTLKFNGIRYELDNHLLNIDNKCLALFLLN